MSTAVLDYVLGAESTASDPLDFSDETLSRDQRLASIHRDLLDRTGLATQVSVDYPATAPHVEAQTATSIEVETSEAAKLLRLIFASAQQLGWRGHIERQILSSKWIPSLSDDWDGEGTPGIAEETWRNAISTLRRLMDVAELSSMAIPVPTIAPNGYGSIDLFWNLGRVLILINVPASSGGEPPSLTVVEDCNLRVSRFLDETDDSYVLAAQVLNP
jgi:hypothetical protein